MPLLLIAAFSPFTYFFEKRDSPQAARADLGIQTDGGAREYHEQVLGFPTIRRGSVDSGSRRLKVSGEPSSVEKVWCGSVVVVASIICVLHCRNSPTWKKVRRILFVVLHTTLLFLAVVNTPMISSFKSWERRRRHLAPEAERILPLIAAAGTAGMTRRQIGNAVDLSRETLDQLLSGLVGIGLLTLALERGVPVYRAGTMGG
jgi:hypothetical protein